MSELFASCVLPRFLLVFCQIMTACRVLLFYRPLSYNTQLPQEKELKRTSTIVLWLLTVLQWMLSHYTVQLTINVIELNSKSGICLSGRIIVYILYCFALSVVRLAVSNGNDVTITWCKESWRRGQWPLNRKWHHM